MAVKEIARVQAGKDGKPQSKAQLRAEAARKAKADKEKEAAKKAKDEAKSARQAARQAIWDAAKGGKRVYKPCPCLTLTFQSLEGEPGKVSIQADLHWGKQSLAYTFKANITQELNDFEQNPKSMKCLGLWLRRTDNQANSEAWEWFTETAFSLSSLIHHAKGGFDWENGKAAEWELVWDDSLNGYRGQEEAA